MTDLSHIAFDLKRLVSAEAGARAVPRQLQQVGGRADRLIDAMATGDLVGLLAAR